MAPLWALEGSIRFGASDFSVFLGFADVWVCGSALRRWQRLQGSVCQPWGRGGFRGFVVQ